MIEAARVVGVVDERRRLVETRRKVVHTIETDAPVNTHGLVKWVAGRPHPKPLFIPGSIS